MNLTCSGVDVHSSVVAFRPTKPPPNERMLLRAHFEVRTAPPNEPPVRLISTSIPS